ncbi:outer membrane protein assembly factor BamE [Arsenicitalea aurantiaca]|uniref:Outer membrane protein assembly factor BamE n=1 Tax=Arsenicitalea aurantiaca TaxID=1783274 RepID=A0A433XEM3_9HYPH|nr:outer membrane protein assembly factor BamE [Arsenicitalea aurantiaca]RUT32545.1 outer membrane protein assembly factor BamE [Arsenicitalea aurantiaca]
MPFRAAKSRFFPLIASATVALVLAGCTAGSGLALTQQRTQGYSIPQDAIAQIRPGQSADLVRVVLGSPMTTNVFGEETAWYYIETKVDQTAFGMTSIRSRTVLAVYFDRNQRVADTAIYTAEDGRMITIESRRTPSFGQDRTFVESILSSF